MNAVIIVLGIIVIVLLYFLYLYVYASSTVLLSQANLNNANQAITVTASPNATRFAVGVWVYVNTWSSNQKPLLSMTGATPNIPLFALSLDASMPILRLQLDTLHAQYGSPQNIVVTNDFPLQKWTYVTFSVDNQYVDLYLDGKLVKSVTIDGQLRAPSNTGVSIYIGQVHGQTVANDIYMSKLLRWTNPVTPQNVWTQYLQGNGQSWMATQYGMNVGIMQNNYQTASFRVI